MLPYLQNGQIILLNPGRTFGAIHAQSIIQKERPDLNVFVGETQTLLFTCRKIKDTGVFINKIKERVSYCFFPETDNELARGLMEELFPSLVPVDDILITSMNNIGAMVHPAGVLLNAGAIARAGQFEFYRQGMTREISRVIEAIDKERCLIVQRLGLPATTFLDWIRESYGVKARTVHEAFNVVMAYQGILAPDQLDTRYLLEDIPTGLVPMSSIGKMLRVDTPNIDAVIVLASALLGQDFTSTGRTLERVGFPLEILIRSALDTSEYTPSGKFWI